MTSYEILEEIESIKYKISDLEYKKILDLLMKLNKEETSNLQKPDISFDDFINLASNSKITFGYNGDRKGHGILTLKKV